MNTNLNLDLFVQPFTCAYNRHVHRSTGMTYFRLSLTFEPPIPALCDIPSALFHDAYQQIPAKLFFVYFIHLLLHMCMNTDKTFYATQTPYQQYFDESVWNIRFFCPGDYVYVDQPPALKTATEQMADKPWLKLLPKVVWPFRITAVTPHIITLDQNGFLIVISIDRATPAPLLKNAPQPCSQYVTYNSTMLLHIPRLKWHEVWWI